MALFRYEATDKNGRVVRGAMDARDESQVANNLVKMGYSVQTIRSTAPRPASTATQAPAVASRATRTATATPVSVRSAVPLASLAMFFRQLASLVKSGQPVYQSLSDILKHTRQRHLRRVLPEMCSAVQSGRSLSAAMAAYPGIFPAWTVASLWTGELSGTLEIAIEEVADDLEAEAKDARYGSIWWGITKLTVVFGLLTVPLCDLSKILSPLLSMESPSQNALSLVVASIISSLIKWLPIAVGVGVAFLVWTAIKRIPSVRAALDEALLIVPVWGKLHKYRSVSRFLRAMDRLYAAGVSPDTAWIAASLTAHNYAVARRLKAVAPQAGASEGPSARLNAAGLFENDDIGLTVAGERSGNLPNAFSQLARIYQDRAGQQKTLGKTFSISAFITFQIAVSGILTILLAYSYFNKLLFGAAGGLM
ncbi:MAG: type II secretion system F family protein [Armatimonadota bacterium]|jgi:type IV pilus assembly protein PilC